VVTPDAGARRILVVGLTTAAGVAMLFAYPTSLNRSAPSAGTPARTGAGSSTGGTGSGTAGSGTAGSGTASSGTVTGDAVDTRWGPVQVEITVVGGRVAAARTLQVPDRNRADVEINDYAVPVLNQEAVQAGSAEIDAVSGATVTSEGYIASLQSALDKAHL
jgi:uncharacterized protein with FMN-binding domain